MTHTTKWIVGVLIVLGLLGVVCVAAVVGFVYYLNRGEGSGEYGAKQVEGREFGKTTDQAGCMKEGLSRAKAIRLVDLNRAVNNRVFVEECVKSASPTSGFCNGVPPLWKLQDDDWVSKQCDDAGLDQLRTSCKTVFQAKLSFCRGL
jgi:hypothetical protein